MAVGYRAIARLDDSEDAISVAESQLSSWFREKKQQGSLTIADWDGDGQHTLGSSATLSVVHDPDRQDGSRRRLYRFRELNSTGLWTVSLSALIAPNANSFQQTIVVDVDVDLDDTEQAIERVDPPRLIRKLLEAHQAMDGVTQLTGEPQVIRGSDAQLVVDAITDPTRIASVIVAPLPWVDGEELWRKAIRALTTQSVGVAAVFILDDDATELVSNGLPGSHGIQRGVIRTFAPDVDLASVDDALRHPKLHPGSLIKHLNGTKVSRALTKLHARSTRLRFIERELPSDVRRGLDILARAEAAAQRTRDVDRRVIETLPESEHRDSVDAAATGLLPSGRLQQLVSRWLGPDKELSDDTFVELDRLLSRKSAEASQWEEDWTKVAEANERLESSARESKSRLENIGLDLAVAEESLRKQEREVVVLRHRLVKQGAPELTYVEPESESWSPPDDIMSLLDRITPGNDPHVAFSRVEFTGDTDAALEVQQRDISSLYTHALWDYVHVLHDYAERRASGAFRGGVHLYLKTDSIDGHKCHPDRHAPGESPTTLNKWGRERIRPVPTSVDPSGQILMAAHFKPTWRDHFAPRMHYFDDTNGSGKIYIGYIGRHLTGTDS